LTYFSSEAAVEVEALLILLLAITAAVAAVAESQSVRFQLLQELRILLPLAQEAA
jgi:hypothetical protein